jgi:hypothetical protein
MSNLYRWPSKDAAYQVSIHLATRKHSVKKSKTTAKCTEKNKMKHCSYWFEGCRIMLISIVSLHTNIGSASISNVNIVNLKYSAVL